MKLKTGADLQPQRSAIYRRVNVGLNKRKFDSGNGEKILKRLLGLAGNSATKLYLPNLYKVLTLRPALRETVYDYISKSRLTLPRVIMLKRFVETELLVDQGGMIELANLLVETPVDGGKATTNAIDEIIDSVDPSKDHGFHIKIWLYSKYRTPADIITLLENNTARWGGSYKLGRLVAGMHPIFINTPEWGQFKEAVAESRNDGAREVYKFHERLKSEIKIFNQLFSMLVQPNPSRGTGITHPKFLCLLSALQNSKAPAAKINKLVNAHGLAWKDSAYRKLAIRAAGISI